MTPEIAARREVERDELTGHMLAAHLDGMSDFGERRRAVIEDERHHSWGFVIAALGIARDHALGWDHQHEWAELAVEACRVAPCCRAQELESLAWAVLGNCRRRSGDLARAGIAFGHCSATRIYTADQLDLAETFSLEASLRHDLLDLAAARELIERAIETARPYATPDRMARYQVKAALIDNSTGRHSRALGRLLAHLPAIDPAAEPQLFLSASHNAAGALLGLGRPEAAMQVLLEIEGACERHASPRLRLQRDWQVAQVAAFRGHSAEAVARLRQVRDGFVAEGLPYDAALLELELAVAHHELGEWSEAERSAARAMAALKASGADREALCALVLVVRSVYRHRASAVLRRVVQDARCRRIQSV